MDPNFNLSLNLAGVAASGGGKPLTEGYYAGVVVDCYAAQNSNGGTRIVFKIGNFEGFGNAVRTTSITVPTENTKPGLLNVWRAAFESAGYTPAQIDSGVINMTRDTFVNRPIHIYYKPGDRDAGIYDELKILSPAAWNTQKASFEASSGSALGSAGAAPAPQAQQAPLGGAAYNPTSTGVSLGGNIGGGMQTAPANNGVPQGQTPAALRNMLGMN